MDYRVNPLTVPRSGPLGIVSGARTLTWAVESLARACTHGLVVGPNVNVLASENPLAFESARVSRILVPSEWVRTMWASDLPAIADRLATWPCGVDYDLWRPPVDRSGPLRPLVYVKVAWPGLLEEVEASLRSAGLAEWAVISYGSHSPDEFKRLLGGSSCLIYIGGSESQGLALLEAWAMDVPTFVFDAPSQAISLSDGRRLTLMRGEFHPAPYLSAATGALWSDPGELPSLICRVGQFTPRAGTQGEFSDAVRTQHYLSFFDGA